MSTINLATAAAAVSELARAKDPKKAILDKLEPSLKDVEIMFNGVLLATYIRPEKTAGGIIRPGTNVAEDEWQGKVGLVLKLGPNAYVDDDESQFYDQKAEIGEWVVYKVGDSWPVQVGGLPCRLVKDSAIRMKVKDPNIIF